MKKTFFLLSAIVLFSACKASAPAVKPGESSAPQTQSEAVDQFAKVAEAIQAGRPVACTFTKTDGSSTMHYEMKGKQVRVSGMPYQGKSQDGVMISDGQMMYLWDNLTKQGMKIAVPNQADLSQVAKDKGQNIPSVQSEADKKNWEDQGYRVDCQETTVADSDFVPPTDVKFTDTSAMMNAAKQMQVNPSSLTPDQQKQLEDQAKQMMQQYGQPNTK